MNMDLNIIQRNGYTVLDILSDVGGLQGILISGISLFLGVWNYNNLENYLASKFYRFNPSSNKRDSSKSEELSQSESQGLR